MSKFIKIVTFDTNVTQAERKKVTGYCDVQKRKSYLFRDYSEKVRVAFHDAAYWGVCLSVRPALSMTHILFHSIYNIVLRTSLSSLLLTVIRFEKYGN